MNPNSSEASRARARLGRGLSLPLLLIGALLAGLVVLVAPGSPAAAQTAPVAGVYMPLTPSRILDTRNAGSGGIIAAQTSRDIQVTSLGGVPATDVLAVVFDLSAVNNTSDGWGLLWQQGTTRPSPASSINYVPGRAVTNAVTVKVGATGKVSYFTWVATDLILDVVGYYRSSPGGGGYVPVTQTRVLDTRDSGVKMAAGSTMDRKLRGVAGVPDSANVTAVAVNVSALDQDGPGFVTFWPRGMARPGTSSLNFGTQRMQTELVVATLSADGWTSIYDNTSANIHVLLDVVGYYTTGAGARFVPLTPTRIVDTRYHVPGWGIGPITQPLAANTNTAIQLTGVAGVPTTGVSTVLLNVIAGDTPYVGWLNFWASGDVQPSTVSHTYYPNESTANLVMAKVGPDGKAIVSNYYGISALIIDVVGYFSTRPPSPTQVIAEAGNAVATVGWVPPDPTGGPVDSYEVTGCPGGVVASQSCPGARTISVAGDVWDARFEGLTNGEIYTFAVVARSAAGISDVATSNAAYPRAPMTLGHENAASAKGGGHTLVVNTDGTVSAWGLNAFGQLGDGTTANNGGEANVGGLTDVIAVAAGERHSLALKSDGTVWAWGDNSSFQLGRRGIATSTTPVRVSDLVGISAIAAGAYHSVALTTTGTVWVWGEGASAQLGGAITAASESPIPIVELSNIKNIAAAGSYSLALHTDGSVWGWGSNSSGQLGFPAGGVKTQATRISGLPAVRAVAAGKNHAMALSTTGTVSAWGANDWGQLADPSLSPGMVSVAGLSGISAIAAGERNSLALKSDGTVWSWGANDWGQLGLGYSTNTPNPSPAQMLKSPSEAPTPITGVESITAGWNGVLVVPFDGATWEVGQHFVSAPDRCVLAMSKGTAKTTKRRVLTIVPVPNPRPTGRADRKLYRMNAQLQEGILDDHSIGRPINQDVPITRAQLMGKMKQIYDEGPTDPKGKFYPWNSGKAKLELAINALNFKLQNFGPICDFKKNFLQEKWTIPGYQEFRLDLDNFAGCNLAS